MRRLAIVLWSLTAGATLCAGVIDRVVLGNAASEEVHGFADGGTSRVETGAKSRTCRRIKKPEKAQWRAGQMKFRLKVAKEGRTYLKVVLWGGDTSHDHLLCTIDGKSASIRGTTVPPKSCVVLRREQ